MREWGFPSLLASFSRPPPCPLVQVALAAHLRHHVRWLRELAPDAALDRPRAAWLFALCAAVGKPLDPDTQAALRDLLRTAALRRADKVRSQRRVTLCHLGSMCVELKKRSRSQPCLRWRVSLHCCNIHGRAFDPSIERPSLSH